MPGALCRRGLVFIWAFTDLGVPLVFGYRNVVPVQIFNPVSEICTPTPRATRSPCWCCS